MPGKFACLPDRKRRTEDTTFRPLAVKRQRLETIVECESQIEQTHSLESIFVALTQPAPSSGKQCIYLHILVTILPGLCKPFRDDLAKLY